MKVALIPCTSTSVILNRLSFFSWWKDLKCFHAHSVGNGWFEILNLAQKPVSGESFCPRTLSNALIIYLRYGELILRHPKEIEKKNFQQQSVQPKETKKKHRCHNALG